MSQVDPHFPQGLKPHLFVCWNVRAKARTLQEPPDLPATFSVSRQAQFSSSTLIVLRRREMIGNFGSEGNGQGSLTKIRGSARGSQARVKKRLTVFIAVHPLIQGADGNFYGTASFGLLLLKASAQKCGLSGDGAFRHKPAKGNCRSFAPLRMTVPWKGRGPELGGRGKLGGRGRGLFAGLGQECADFFVGGGTEVAVELADGSE
jgi:hypothetical protein